MSKINKILKLWINEFGLLDIFGIKGSEKRLVESLSELIANEVNYGEVNEDYLNQYNCVQLTEMLSN